MKDPQAAWSDRDFVPPEQPWSTLPELGEFVRYRLSLGDLPHDLGDNLRIYILARIHQGLTQRDVEDELSAWGMPPDLAIQWVSETRSQRKESPVPEGETVTFRRMNLGFYRNPAYGRQVRKVERATRLDEQARLLAIGGRVGPGQTDPNFRFDDGVPYRPNDRPDWTNRLAFIIVALAVLSFVSVFTLICLTD